MNPRMTLSARALVTGVAAIGVLLATSGASIGQETTLRLIVPVSGSGDALSKLAQQYGEATDGVTVNIQSFPAGDHYGQALVTQLQSGAGVDLMYTNAGYGALEAMLPLGEAGRLADMSAASWAAEVPSSAKPDYMLGDALYGLPLSLTSVGMVYNGALLNELGITYPTTEDEFFAACATAAEQGKSFSSAAGPSPFYIIETLAASKVYAANPDWNEQRRNGAVSFADTPGWVDTFETYARMASEGCFQRGFEAAGIPDLFGAMAGGLVVSGIGPATLAGAVMGMNPEVTLTVGPWPAAENTVALGYYNDAISINAASANLDAAKAFVDWLAQPEQLETYASTAGGVAPSSAAAGNFPPLVAGLAPYYSAGQIVGMPHTGWPNAEVRDAINRGAAQLVTGQASVAEVLGAMDAAWDK